jgi:hypothetical protein
MHNFSGHSLQILNSFPPDLYSGAVVGDGDTLLEAKTWNRPAVLASGDGHAELATAAAGVRPSGKIDEEVAKIRIPHNRPGHEQPTRRPTFLRFTTDGIERRKSVTCVRVSVNKKLSSTTALEN